MGIFFYFFFNFQHDFDQWFFITKRSVLMLESNNAAVMFFLSPSTGFREMCRCFWSSARRKKYSRNSELKTIINCMQFSLLSISFKFIAWTSFFYFWSQTHTVRKILTFLFRTLRSAAMTVTDWLIDWPVRTGLSFTVQRRRGQRDVIEEFIGTGASASLSLPFYLQW